MGNKSVLLVHEIQFDFTSIKTFLLLELWREILEVLIFLDLLSLELRELLVDHSLQGSFADI